ncbi:sigma-70 family RNA polymerase sigma factor [Asanoa sp. NPDC049518]|uniref:sigma-70 family RNA polymerase sigma factor n=1 Tax=unclassified Asanoa TaxID=2685164 RepID=UPI00343F85BC
MPASRTRPDSDLSLDEAASRYATTRTEPGARDAFVLAAMPFADRLASRYRGRGVPLDDLRQVARLALIKAVNQLDPERGSFTAYAVTTVRGELRRHFRNTAWDLRVPRPLQELTVDAWKAVDDLTGDLSRAPTRAELAAQLGVGERDVDRALQASNAYTAASLDAPAHDQSGRDGDGPALGGLLGAPDADLESVDDRLTVRRLLAQLPAREQQILALRFYGNRSQTEIAQATGMSQMHVSRLLSRSLTWLREAMLSEVPPVWPGADNDAEPETLIHGVTSRAGVAVVALRGEIDADNAGQLREKLGFYCRHAPAGVQVHLGRVPFVDAAAAAALAGSYAIAQRRGVTFELCAASATVSRSLRAAGLGRLLRLG